MRVTEVDIPGLVVFEPVLYADERGSFMESFNTERYLPWIPETFVQDNESVSKQSVLRGLHLQRQPYAQGKLVRVIQGEVLDVAVDLRPGSKTFGQHHKLKLSGDNKKQFWIPPGFAHGFLTLTTTAVFSYKCTAYYRPEAEITLRWDDPDLAIDWGIKKPVLASRDQSGVSLKTFISTEVVSPDRL